MREKININILKCLKHEVNLFSLLAMSRKTWIKVIIMVGILVISCFSGWSFADWTQINSGSYKNLETFADVLNFAVSILSWIWVWFAKWAWEFLTNKWVYWESLKLDVLLWQYWNVIKNFANFWLWFYFLYVIFKSLIWKEDVTKKIKDMILWILIAWIWIQASWFLTAAVIDLSTITLVAAWSFPSQVISKNTEAQDWFKKSLDNYLNSTKKEASEDSWRLFVLFPTNAKSSSFIETYPIKLTWSLLEEPDKLFDGILPSADNVSWPLYYIGFSILNSNVLPSVWKDDDSWKATILNIVLQGWTTIVYSIEMLILLIFSVMRVIYIWIFIILSPLVILLWSIQKGSWWKSKAMDSGFLGSVTKHINFPSFFLNVFKPTIIVLLMWLTVIFVSLMNKVIIDNIDRNVDIGWVKIVSHKDDWSNINWETYTTTLDSDLLHFGLIRASQTLMWLLLSIITVILVYVIIKVWFNMWEWKDFVSTNIKSVQDLVGKLLASTPVIPVPWYDKEWVPITRSISAWSVFDINTWKSKIFDSWKYNKEQEIKKTVMKDANKVEELFWVSWTAINSLQEQELRWIWDDKKIIWLDKLGKWAEIINSFEGKSWFTLKWNTYNSRVWIDLFKQWLDSVKVDDVKEQGWRDMVKDRQKIDKSDRSLEKLFWNPTYATAYAKFFWYSDKNYHDFGSITNLDISKKKSDWED